MIGMSLHRFHFILQLLTEQKLIEGGKREGENRSKMNCFFGFICHFRDRRALRRPKSLGRNRETVHGQHFADDVGHASQREGMGRK